MKQYLSYLLFLYAGFISIPGYTQSHQDAALTKNFDQLITAAMPNIAPGCVVLAARHGQVIYKKAFGSSSLENKTPMNEDHIFRIGSITKQFTAVAVLQLVEQGKISLKDSVQKYIPQFPSKGNTITIENLLNQTSGITDYMSIKNPSKERDSYTPAQGIDYFKDEPLKFTPGTKFEYSNSNYYLLGYLIEQVTGQSYESYIKANLLEPAGLHHTYYLHREDHITNMASGYSRQNSENWQPAELQEPTIMYAAGGLASNANDLFKWNQALLTGKLISTNTLKQAQSPSRLIDNIEYGYGWFIKQLDGQQTIEHSGSTDGYQTDEIYLPAQDVFVVAFFNGFEEDMDWQVLTNDIARIAAGIRLRKETQINDQSLIQYAGTYIYNAEHSMIITYNAHELFVEAANPKDRLPQVKLHAKTLSRFYIKEAPLEFEFVADGTGKFKLITYNAHGKDAEWKYAESKN